VAGCPQKAAKLGEKRMDLVTQQAQQKIEYLKEVTKQVSKVAEDLLKYYTFYGAVEDFMEGGVASEVDKELDPLYQKIMQIKGDAKGGARNKIKLLVRD
jgi:hypothetical protein